MTPVLSLPSFTGNRNNIDIFLYNWRALYQYDFLVNRPRNRATCCTAVNDVYLPIWCSHCDNPIGITSRCLAPLGLAYNPELLCCVGTLIDQCDRQTNIDGQVDRQTNKQDRLIATALYLFSHNKNVHKLLIGYQTDDCSWVARPASSVLVTGVTRYTRSLASLPTSCRTAV